MTAYELIASADYDNLPEDDGECFVALEEICRRNMNEILGRLEHDEDATPVWESYITTVSQAALECGISNISDDDEINSNSIRFRRFRSLVEAEVTKLRLRGRRRGSQHSVQLTTKTRAQIELQVSHLRHTIEESNLEDRRKKVLLGKLDELAQEIANNRRLSFGKTMAILAPVAAALAVAANFSTVATAGPEAVTKIIALISQDKESEDAARQRLEPPPKALPAPPTSAPKPKPKPSSERGRSYSWNTSSGSDLDDDIPF